MKAYKKVYGDSPEELQILLSHPKLQGQETKIRALWNL